MKFTAAQIAGILEGEVIGNPNAEVFKLSKKSLSTIKYENEKLAYDTRPVLTLHH